MALVTAEQLDPTVADAITDTLPLLVPALIIRGTRPRLLAAAQLIAAHEVALARPVLWRRREGPG